MSRLVAYLLDAVRHPQEKLTRGQYHVRYAWELVLHCYRQLIRHRAEGMAAELTYRTIFSLIPVLVLGLVMFRIFGGLEEVESKLENQLYSFFGVPEIPNEYLRSEDLVEPTPSDSPAEAVREAAESDQDLLPEAAPEPESTSASSISETTSQPSNATTAEPAQQPQHSNIGSDQILSDAAESNADQADARPPEVMRDAEAAAEAEAKSRASIRRTLGEVTDKIANLDFASIGVFGLLLFIYAAVALADSVEYLFNRIYDAPRQRPIHIRLAIHWSIITLGSGLLALSLYLSSQVLEWFSTMDAVSTFQPILNHGLSIAAGWVLLFLMYALMPNTHVSVRAAAIGASVGAFLWEGAKFGFNIYVAKALPYSAFYGSLGLIPLFLLWIYVTWLIVLFGLILTYTLQSLRGRKFIHREDFAEKLLRGDPDWMLPIMAEISRSFQQGDSIDNQEIADRLGLTSRVVHEMTAKLIETNLLRTVTTGAGEESTLTLARPADRITVAEILDIAHHTRPVSDNPAWKTLDNYNTAQRAAANGKTLAEITIPDDNST